MPEPAHATLLADCVHCGFCLPACPTYRSWGDEADSPRGRIDLMKAIDEGSLALDAAAARHFDSCLSCLACVPACPSGVQYGSLIEHTRERVERTVRRSSGERAWRAAIFALFPYPQRLRALAVAMFAFGVGGAVDRLAGAGVLARLPARLKQLLRLAPPLTLADVTASLPAFEPARAPRRGRVALVAGCVQRVFFPRVNAATVRVLSAEGFDVAIPPGQGCCGALSLHAGRTEEARRFARALIECFERSGADAVVTNSAGCGSALKEYGRLFSADPQWRARAATFAAKVRDVSEFLAAIPARAPRGPVPGTVAYHDACHLAQAQGVRAQPRDLLRGIPGLELVEVGGPDACCGSAGIYNLVEPESAAEIGARKLDAVLATGADTLASGNPGCTLHLQSLAAGRGVRLVTAHPVELLDASLSGASLIRT